MTKTVLIALVILVSFFAASAQSEAKVDEFVKTAMDMAKIPGISLAVIKDGRPAIVKGYGLANIEHNVPVKPETIFQSGSVGKQFTAFAVMLLVDEGKIGIDDKIGNHLEDVPDAWSNITVRHLLTHTSGMTDYPDSFDFRKDYTEDELLKIIKETPLAFKPGERWQYSNLGYVTLGIIIHKVSGKFYGDFLAERVFKPLGMTTARVISERDIVPNRAAGYVLRNGEVKNQGWVSPSLNTTADGALYLSALDMIKWEGGLAGGKLLSRRAYDQMWTRAKLNNGRERRYGFGWALRNLNGKVVIEHGGAWQGFKTFIARYPDRKLAVIVFANLADVNPAKLASGIAEAFDPTLQPQPVADPDPKRTAEIRQLFEAVLNGIADENRFAPSVRKLLLDPNDRLIAHLKNIRPILKFDLVELSNDGGFPTYRYRADFGSMAVTIEVETSKDGKIEHFELHPE